PASLDPALTEDREGFNHLTMMKGEVEEAKSQYIIRNHDKDLFEQQKKTFQSIASFMNERYGYMVVDLDIKDSYHNMYEILKDHMDIIELAQKAIRDVGITPFSEAIRGGTDGARLTFDGLPCPNLGTGGYNFHGRYEFASMQQMEKALLIMINIVKLAAANDPA
ncbi:MAG: peptidase T, partial [Acholeplasmataceae bacterium]|nr:peptidase T [Acholeplasmataceae bacterium]